jgi:hypothetical protein
VSKAFTIFPFSAPFRRYGPFIVSKRRANTRANALNDLNTILVERETTLNWGRKFSSSVQNYLISLAQLVNIEVFDRLGGNLGDKIHHSFQKCLFRGCAQIKS